MKTFKILAVCLFAVIGLYSCGSDKNEDKKEEANKVYFVKSITCVDHYNNDDEIKYTFTYDSNNRLVKVLKEKSDFIEYGTYSYQGNTITEKWTTSEEYVSSRLSRVITMDASNEFNSYQALLKRVHITILMTQRKNIIYLFRFLLIQDI